MVILVNVLVAVGFIGMVVLITWLLSRSKQRKVDTTPIYIPPPRSLEARLSEANRRAVTSSSAANYRAPSAPKSTPRSSSRAAVSSASPRREDSYNPLLDPLNPMNPLSPIHHSAVDPTPSCAPSSYSGSYDSGGSSYDSGGGGSDSGGGSCGD
jgi:hypothetical protein